MHDQREIRWPQSKIHSRSVTYYFTELEYTDPTQFIIFRIHADDFGLTDVWQEKLTKPNHLWAFFDGVNEPHYDFIE